MLVLVSLLGLASRQHHESTANVETFRFPPILITALRLGVTMPPLMGYGIYISFGRPLEGYESGFLIVFFGSLTLIIAAQLWGTSHYLLELRTGRITVNDWRGRRTTSIEEIGKVQVSYPWRGRGYLDLYNAAGNKLERIDGGVQDFDDLSDSVINQCELGTIVCEKRPGGKWIEHVL